MIEKVEQTPYQIEEAKTRGSLARQMLAELIMETRRTAGRHARFGKRFGPNAALTESELERYITIAECAETLRRILYGLEL
jgi:hypothetical protein